ncbi:nitrilase-related carbon-nitrogen hydrolase [Conexibacter sp. DBS9H8]|uniref:nitrilase-related carbon-nitrogen hydrolase n=1 Tax=Conexibacter sp. DBS9H8 TaxID=2937801 RepID=UPI00200BECDC|nr:nitrilase-related carbon-nitrogen hydrolase [Conexibacter sp. DBS9H8]
MTRIACQQIAPVLGELAANAAAAEAAIRAALDAGAEVVVLPELCTSGYMFSGPEQAAGVAIGRADPILAAWAKLARESGAVICGGFCEACADGRLYNSAALFPGAGPPSFYRKLHLWDREKLVFTPGSELPPVIDTAVGRVAAVVCYDLEFPELTRAIALAGAQLLLVPTNWPHFPRPAGERPAEVVVAMATARMNRMAVACADRAGIERGQAWEQGATIVGADGWVAAESREPGLIVADVDLEAALDKRFTELADAFGDRRSDLYGSPAGVPAGTPR